jgi:hypothetical protein
MPDVVKEKKTTTTKITGEKTTGASRSVQYQILQHFLSFRCSA